MNDVRSSKQIPTIIFTSDIVFASIIKDVYFQPSLEQKRN
jgi:hypothetical protein